MLLTGLVTLCLDFCLLAMSLPQQLIAENLKTLLSVAYIMPGIRFGLWFRLLILVFQDSAPFLSSTYFSS